MDLDDRADVFAILGLAGAGAGLMLVGSLDLRWGAIVLAVVIPSVVAILVAAAVAIIAWNRSRGTADSNHSDAYQRYRSAHQEQDSSVLRAARESHKESL